MSLMINAAPALAGLGRGLGAYEKNDWVRCYQRLLNAYLRSQGQPTIAEDGIFGPKTEDASSAAARYYDQLDSEGYYLDAAVGSSIAIDLGISDCLSVDRSSTPDAPTAKRPSGVTPTYAPGTPGTTTSAGGAKHISLGLGPVDDMLNFAIKHWIWTLGGIGAYVYSRYSK